MGLPLPWVSKRTGNPKSLAVGVSLAINLIDDRNRKVDDASFKTEASTVTVSKDNTVRVNDNHNGPGTPGTVYRYLGENDLEIKLDTQDYDDAALWEEVVDREWVLASIKDSHIETAGPVSVKATSTLQSEVSI